ncbi:MAG: tRNA (adenosine(37)-N6)-threonylcarbamoyltransferase complex transferase subunit TsaD [Bdellovibrionota bacterium]|nr:tRNA (adenosine(37)-N6)-threonylcarbamoyltransferase complex transferase subunit TsaD [Bdellovibrionota bacterium]
MKEKIVLGIETSCDDTSMAIIKGSKNSRPEILAFESFSQETLLRVWGGVVPEIASRNHLEKIGPLLKSVLTKADIKLSELDLIGVTTFPGLLGPLLTGLNAAKTISLIHKKAIIPVNHLFAHLEAIHLSEDVTYPYLGLLVSGGHSLFCIVHSETEIDVIGSTIDDAAGEAFDKGGKLLGLGYPAGRIIDDISKEGNEKYHEFPIGLRGSKDASLSFSGLKTSLRHHIEKNKEYMVHEPQNLTQKQKDLIASYQYAIVKALSLKLKYALQIAKEKTGKDLHIVVGGGVACNSRIRSELTEKYKKVSFVLPKFCTDNGAMIANYALRTHAEAISHPECLKLDARNRFINKKEGKAL